MSLKFPRYVVFSVFDNTITITVLLCILCMCIILYSMLHCISLLSLSEYPRKSLIQDGQALSKHLMTRNSRRNEAKAESNKIVLGKWLVIVLLE